MPSHYSSEFVLLSTLIAVLKDKEYYRTFAKTIAMTSNSEKPMPTDDELVSEMFHYFIQTNLLQIYYNNELVTLDSVEFEVDRRASKCIEESDCVNNSKNLIRNHIWNDEIYINIDELKKLYANKCIVFSNTLLKELHEQENLTN